jgi:IclR family acetate operon transcriptional repressor
MQELLERTDENIHLSVRNDRGITIVEKLESSKVVRPHDPLGLVAPLHATSTGKAILAWSEPEVLDDVLAHGLEGFTARTQAGFWDTVQLVRPGIRADHPGLLFAA